MPDLLIELLSEEIPARFQARAAADLQRLVTGALVEAGLAYEGAKAFATPRRLALTVAGVPARSPDRREERRGPRVGAPDKAVEGFLRGAGLSSIDQAKVRSDPKKGDFYVAVIEESGRTAEDVIAGFMPNLIRTFPWQKSMRWGAASASPGSLAWVRPLHSIVCLFGPETSETEVVPFEVDGIASGRTTRGHRFMAPAPFEVRRFDDYAPALERAKVILDPERRRDTILHDARDRALALSLELVEDDALATEVAGLVEWPVVMIGAFDEAFLEMPFEVIRTTIRTHQKCFVLQKPNGAGPANRFVLVSNLEASDGGAAIVAGNERVIRARLADARYFWDTDLAVPLADRVPALDAITFHEKLGTQGDRVRRIIALARDLAPAVGADPDLAARAAELAKADLVSEMVGEFPELQGFMGGTYARVQGEKPEVVAAISDHYRPQGPSDSVPTEPVTIAVALAEKLDMLVGFWSIDEKPTGSKDPFALRRAALGVIRLVLDNGVRVDLGDMIATHRARFAEGEAISGDLLAFFADRLKVQMRESGARHDLVDAVLAVADPGDLVGIMRRIEALGAFLATEAGGSLLAGYRRGINILTDEEKKSGERYDAVVDPGLLQDPAERSLYEAASAAAGEVKAAVAIEDFADAMTALARLREPVDTFFETVMVNAEDPSVRTNRLRLLNAIRVATLSVADFSRIGG